jgi:glycyl-tRNA synthetase beta subunit
VVRCLLEAVSSPDSEAGRLLADGDFAGLPERAASLMGPADAFFEEVPADDPDPELKTARAALLNRTAALSELAADFSRFPTA